jgi:Cu/Ag efflux protein CusF
VVVAANFLIDAESNLKAAIGGFNSTPAAAPAKAEMPSATGPATPKGAGHQAEGTVDSVDAKAGTINLSHGPVASLKWPAMTMDFKAANPCPAVGAQAGCEGQLRVRRATARRMGHHQRQADGGTARRGMKHTLSATNRVSTLSQTHAFQHH